MTLLMKRKKALGERLKFLRGCRTQEEIAFKLGLSRARYSHYENDRVEPDTETLNKMADLFDVTIDYLLGRSDTPSYTEKEDEEFRKAISDPDLKRWHSELPEEDEEDLKKLKMMWDIIKSDKNNNN